MSESLGEPGTKVDGTELKPARWRARRDEDPMELKSDTFERRGRPAGIGIGMIFLPSVYKLPGILVLAVALLGCRPAVIPEEGPRVEGTSTRPAPSVEAGSPGVSDTVTPALTGSPQMEEPQPTRVVFGSPPIDPTRLPEPHLVRVLDWELVSAESGVLCPACGGDQIVVAAPPGLGIAVVRVYTSGSIDDAAVIDTDLAFSNPVECRGKPVGGFCGLIFGQVSGGKITLQARHLAGADHSLSYLITFQQWEDYSPR